MKKISGNLCHEILAIKKGVLSFSENKDFASWRETVKNKL